ncbi:MAG: hypothetical protein AAGC53_22820, partial [Actinomycetota bacterium]
MGALVIRRLCARLSFVALVAPLALLGLPNGAAASGGGGCVGDHVVVLDQRVDSRAGRRWAPNTISATFTAPIPAGSYQISVVTFDGYEGRSENPQLHEQVVVGIGGAVFGPTPDLADGEDWVTATTSGEIELLEGASTVTISHLLSGTETNNSVGVGCVALSAITSPPPPPSVEIGHDCDAEPAIVVTVSNPGPAADGSVRVDDAVTPVDVAPGEPTVVVIASTPGVHRVVVEIGGVVLVDAMHDVACVSEPPSDGLPDDADPPADTDPPDDADPP